jgi:hypothetical protein
MNRRARILLGLLILSLSLALLFWGYKPLDRINRTQPISPADLQLPTPISLRTAPYPAS